MSAIDPGKKIPVNTSSNVVLLIRLIELSQEENVSLRTGKNPVLPFLKRESANRFRNSCLFVKQIECNRFYNFGVFSFIEREIKKLL